MYAIHMNLCVFCIRISCNCTSRRAKYVLMYYYYYYPKMQLCCVAAQVHAVCMMHDVHALCVTLPHSPTSSAKTLLLHTV